MSATFIKINNSKEAAIKSGKWSDPGAKLYDTLINSHDSRWNVNGRNVFPEDDEAKTWDYWQDFLKEAYLIAPTKDIKNSPYGKTPFSNSGCKYPHHVIRKGELVISIPGLKAAYLRACQQGVMKGEVKDHLERHIKELGIEASFHNGQLTWNESHEIKIEENFNSIYDYIQENTGIDLYDEYLQEASHSKLKYDFRMGWDYNTGHQIKVVYSLDNINITDIGDFYYNYNGKKDGATHDSHLDYTRKNITRKGNTDHQSKGQKVLAIEDIATGERLTSVKLLNPFCRYIDTRATVQTKDNLEKARKYADNENPSCLTQLTVGQIDNTSSYKSTHWASKVMDKVTGENLRFNKIAKSEMLKHGRGHKVDNINAKDFPVFGDDHKYMTYYNPNKKQALNELYMREKDVLNYLRHLKDNYDLNDPKAKSSYQTEMNNLRIIQRDINTIQNGKYDLSIMKKYRSYDEAVDSGLSGNQTLDYNTYMDYRPSMQYIPGEELRENVNISFNEHSENALEGDAELTMTSRIFDETGKTPQSIFNWIRENIEYDNESPDKWKLKSIGETYYHSKGNCHDQSLFSTSLFHSLGIITGQLFFIEYNDGEEVGGNTHTLTWYRNKDNIKQYYWVETAWETQAGIHGPYSSIDDIKKDVHDRWKKEFGEKWDDIEFSDTSNYHLGMSLDQYVQSWVFKDVETLIKESLDWIDSFVHDEVFREEVSSNEENSEVETQEEVTDDNPPSIDDNAGSEKTNEKSSEDHTKDDGNIEDEQVDEEPQSEDNKSNDTEEEPEKEVKEEKPVSRPKQTDDAEKDKNGVRRKKLYIAFIEWCKEYNSKNTFGSIFDKDAFNVSYPFVPKEMRYFYRLANPMLCVLSGNLTFFPVAELRKLNSKNSHLDQMMIFAATEEDVRVFNRKDKKVYKGIEENGTLKLSEVLSDTFDLYIQNMIKKGDILNGPIEDENSSEENK